MYNNYPHYLWDDEGSVFRYNLSIIGIPIVVYHDNSVPYNLFICLAVLALIQ